MKCSLQNHVLRCHADKNIYWAELLGEMSLQNHVLRYHADKNM